MKHINSYFRRVKLLALDVDGVLTDGSIIYDDKGRELKSFNVYDGLGIFILSRMGINTVLISAKKSSILERRAKDMRVKEVIGGILPKRKVINYLMEKYKVKKEEVCFIGDDLIDLGIMREVGIPVAVKNASLPVKREALYVTQNKGGEGAVREVVELILKAKNLWKKTVKEIDSFLSK
ncbi:MAG: hypothetical protein DRP76_02995 [Candidatus Omnitrophota bacterium]|nr:MAG: hypothetical protein DRP76_02995 [Candidatus Omnitrophota bacterium]